MYKTETVARETKNYFKGDELATNVFMTKYALKDREGNYMEKCPDDMHKRLASEFARMENKFNSPRKVSEKKIYEYIKDFKYIVFGIIRVIEISVMGIKRSYLLQYIHVILLL